MNFKVSRTQYAMQHDSVLCIKTGPDRVLRHSYCFFLVAGFFAILISPAVLWLKVLCMSGGLFCALKLLSRKKTLTEGSLMIFPDGRAKWKLNGEKSQAGIISSNFWLVSRYAVLVLVRGSHHHKLLISQSRQDEGNFRVLASWLRLKAWNQE